MGERVRCDGKARGNDAPFSAVCIRIGNTRSTTTARRSGSWDGRRGVGFEKKRAARLASVDCWRGVAVWSSNGGVGGSTEDLKA
ncbi:hypothetical protein CMUS01_13177 [Colletotrichum musicola]|uniref:Uncharacterized protein n=1 Tax=Colletotrichum musicola TaxID=2175873 RepID=A0A8H6JF15_9PEZI|nr:hypothetical protein CMUS01_13177 [Colletotrichum musicola]